MTKFKLLILFLLLLSNISFGQNCTCEKDFRWVKKTFEENDAGFQYTLEIKGKQAYETHSKLFLQKVKNIKQSEECTKLLYEWLTFFRAGHIGIRKVEKSNLTTPIKQNKPNSNWEIINTPSNEFENYLNNKKEADYEGIWEAEPYKIGIKKVGQLYVGFIIETTAENWKQGEVKFKFDDKKGTYFLRDKSVENFTVIKAVGKNYLQLGRFLLNRLYPKYETAKSITTFIKSISTEKPYSEEINSTTLLLRIPSFDGSQKKDIDSVILANKSKILKTENLIIDLRNNGGGSDESYKEIIPFIYTNPIREVGVEMLSTKLNNQRMLDFINKPEWGFDEERKKTAKTSYDTLEKHLGSFVNLNNIKISIQKLDTVYPFPKNVGIIIHKGNGSTTEQFLLAAKQSKKVKLFGTTTFGALDISNMNFVKSPCNEFELGYCLSKSFRIPNMAIDSKGIQPDYFLEDEIEEYNWVDYVTKILEQK